MLIISSSQCMLVKNLDYHGETIDAVVLPACVIEAIRKYGFGALAHVIIDSDIKSELSAAAR
jgi:hypothetical protein